MYLIKLHSYISQTRPDVSSMWEENGIPKWDTSLPNQQQIIDLVTAFDTLESMPKIPQSVTPRQIRQALILNGVYPEQIEAAINGLPEPSRGLALIEWEYSIAFERNRPLVAQIGMILGWNDTQLDALWIQAGGL